MPFQQNETSLTSLVGTSLFNHVSYPHQSPTLLAKISFPNFFLTLTQHSFSFQNDATSSDSVMEEETTATTRQLRPTTSTGTLTLAAKKFLRKLWNYLISNTKRKQPVAQLPLDVVAEILCRLPVKCLLRFRCVCKLWNSLISIDRSFANKHLRVSTKRHHVVTSSLNYPPKLTVMSYPLDSFQLNSSFTSDATFSFDHSFLYQLNTTFYSRILVGSCDGLPCFAIGEHITVIWNPSTRKLKKLPSSKIPQKKDAIGNNSFTNYAFGYDPFIDNYKIVSVFCYDSQYVGNRMKSCKTQVQVHTLGTDSWRRISDFPSTMVPRGRNESGIIVSGTGKSVTKRFQSLTTELMPVYSTLGMIRDCLCIFSHSEYFTDVWLMKEYGNKESWMKLIRLPIFDDHGNYVDNPKILYISEDDNHVLLLLKENPKCSWLVYDARNDTKKIFETQVRTYAESTVYVESLVSP
ncbi:putative F-box domain-containing protein [Medicago truncatula]|uniref:Putative F-box domain-containing protein n=1 Tax=Medicago truncatula TaxID=3880 RepID=A0A396JT10_MEDTR|nr:putative F-box domain-containing protein [Medicago truncatula]